MLFLPTVACTVRDIPVRMEIPCWGMMDPFGKLSIVGMCRCREQLVIQ